MKKAWIIIGSIVVLLFLVGTSFVGMYNRLVGLNENVTTEWSQIENQLQRRNDLIPNLVNTVKGYAKHEKEIFENVANARAKLAGAATVSQAAQASGELQGALSRLLAIAENYPQLKANENFIRLQDELAGTENRIAVARQRYNESVRNYNVAIRRFPGNIVASFAGFQKKDAYFQAEEAAKEVPNVQF